MEKNTYFHRLHAQTPTRMWINNVTREQARMAIAAGAAGCTQNPAYTWKMMQNEEERPYVMAKLDEILRSEPDDNEALIKLQRELIQGVAEIFMEMYERSHGRDGYVSIQGDPFNETGEAIARYARFNTSPLPNMTAKVPVVEGGLEAIPHLVEERIPINCTEIMAVRQALDVAGIYREYCKKMKDPAPMFYSVITGIFDEYLHKYVAERNIDISPDVLWQAGIAVAKKAYWMMKEAGSPCRFIGGGARGLQHFTEMVGADCIVTINWTGTADKLIEQDPPVVQRFFMPVPHSVEDELLRKVDEFRRAYLVDAITPGEYESYGPVVLFRSSFESAWKNALAEVGKRRAQLG